MSERSIRGSKTSLLQAVVLTFGATLAAGSLALHFTRSAQTRKPMAAGLIVLAAGTGISAFRRTAPPEIAAPRAAPAAAPPQRQIPVIQAVVAVHKLGGLQVSYAPHTPQWERDFRHAKIAKSLHPVPKPH